MLAIDKFYYKVEQELLHALITEEVLTRNVVCVPWDNYSWYLSWDRVSFYFIPDKKLFLMSELKRPVNEVFDLQVQTDHLCTVNNLKLNQVKPTGAQRNLSPFDEKHPSVAIEMSSGEWLLEEALRLFPKQRFYCRSTDNSVPTFIFSKLKVPLGGVWPLANVPDNDNSDK